MLNIDWLGEIVECVCGEIVIDKYGVINVLGVFVVGDCINNLYK